MDYLLQKIDAGFDALSGRFRDVPVAVFLLSPALLLLFVFTFAPMLYAVYMSLFGGKQGMGDFVGLANYAEALRRPDFWNSVRVTMYYVLGTVPITMLLSFVVAYALNRIVFGRGFFRTVYFLPYITSTVAAAMVWRAIYSPQFGYLNAFLTYIGLPAQQWLLEPRGILHLMSGGWIPHDVGPSLALCCIMAFDVWHGSGFMIVIFLAGLAAIPRELEEVARLDGAGTLQVMRHITLPLLSPTLFFLAIIGTVRAFQSFNSFFALTQGGGRTLGTTENLILYIYANFYEYGFWGYGAAVATLLSLGIMGLTLLQWRFIGRRVHYE